jgi:hypothetical protein
VLDDKAVIIFSVHNARCIFPRTDATNLRARAEYIASRLCGRWRVGLRCCGNLVSVGLRLKGCAWLAGGSIRHKLFCSLFWQGNGYFVDFSNGHLLTRAATPEVVTSEMDGLGFEAIDVLGCQFPLVSGRFTTGWFYYVCRKRTRPKPERQ